MRILIANKFWYRRGGDCVYAMALKELLEKAGHEVAVYSMQYPQNEESEWSGWWPSEMTTVKALTRPLGACEVGGRRKTFEQIKDEPDSFLALDEVETGYGNRIPLWLFGFLY